MELFLFLLPNFFGNKKYEEGFLMHVEKPKQRPYPISNYDTYRKSCNPYEKKIRSIPKRMAPTCFTCEETEAWRGKWREFFQATPEQKLHVELGSYHGEALIEMAAKNPKELFIGIDWKFKETYKAAKKAAHLKLKNIVFLRANMARLSHIFDTKEVDQVWILFPDPWPKFSQQKRRVMHRDFFSQLALLLQKGKKVLIKTDHDSYATFISEELKETHYFDVIKEDKEEEKLLKNFPTTSYEKIFLNNNSTIFSFALVRNGNRVVLSTPIQKILHPAIL